MLWEFEIQKNMHKLTNPCHLHTANMSLLVNCTHVSYEIFFSYHAPAGIQWLRKSLEGGSVYAVLPESSLARQPECGHKYVPMTASLVWFVQDTEAKGTFEFSYGGYSIN